LLLRLNQVEKNQLKWVVDNTTEFKSMHEFCHAAVVEKIKMYIIKLTEV